MPSHGRETAFFSFLIYLFALTDWICTAQKPMCSLPCSHSHLSPTPLSPLPSLTLAPSCSLHGLFLSPPHLPSFHSSLTQQQLLFHPLLSPQHFSKTKKKEGPNFTVYFHFTTPLNTSFFRTPSTFLPLSFLLHFSIQSRPCAHLPFSPLSCLHSTPLHTAPPYSTPVSPSSPSLSSGLPSCLPSFLLD